MENEKKRWKGLEIYSSKSWQWFLFTRQSYFVIFAKKKKILFLHFHHSPYTLITTIRICCSCRSIVFVEKELLKNCEFANFDENNAKLMRKVPTLLFTVSVFLSLQTNSAELASGQKEILAISPFSCRLIKSKMKDCHSSTLIVKGVILFAQRQN
jgi:hypothetical protein